MGIDQLNATVEVAESDPSFLAATEARVPPGARLRHSVDSSNRHDARMASPGSVRP